MSIRDIALKAALLAFTPMGDMLFGRSIRKQIQAADAAIERVSAETFEGEPGTDEAAFYQLSKVFGELDADDQLSRALIDDETSIGVPGAVVAFAFDQLHDPVSELKAHLDGYEAPSREVIEMMQQESNFRLAQVAHLTDFIALLSVAAKYLDAKADNWTEEEREEETEDLAHNVISILAMLVHYRVIVPTGVPADLVDPDDEDDEEDEDE